MVQDKIWVHQVRGGTKFECTELGGTKFEELPYTTYFRAILYFTNWNWIFNYSRRLLWMFYGLLFICIIFMFRGGGVCIKLWLGFRGKGGPNFIWCFKGGVYTGYTFILNYPCIYYVYMSKVALFLMPRPDDISRRTYSYCL